jgi:hypothetical protein
MTGMTVLYRPDCKLWSCPHCATVKQKQWSARVRACVRDNPENDWHFVTLTIEESSGLLARQIEIWSHAWDVFSKRLRRAVERKITYVVIPELSPEKKRLHAHMILDWDMQMDCYKRFHPAVGDKPEFWKYYSKWLHENLKPSGLGYIYDIQPLVEPSLASYYVTKYIGKGLSEVFPKGFRRVRTSQGFPTIEDTQPTEQIDWQVIHCNEDGRRILLRALLSGEVIFEVATQSPVTLKHPRITELDIVG